ncbi:uncharacterized protein LOC110876226 [Helianthus annuus]|uniref:uncharacterized protein LOC110876226 n=1 Tax=Helianthus annuus TaxID=4232 RepID=UPI0016531B78|nr:uncharacterized protein LOC110876226 [Helianthus annuus]
MSQYGYEKAYKDYSFDTDQSRVSLYMTAVASLSQLVQKPTVTVSPKTGLVVTLSGSAAATGSPPTTLSPTLLNVDCRCQTARDDPYEVQLTIPVEGYDPIQFSLTKMCECKQNEAGTSSKGWALFGIFSCIHIFEDGLLLFTKLRCSLTKRGGADPLSFQHCFAAVALFTRLKYKDKQVSGGGGYMRADDFNGAYASQASWTREPVSDAGSSRTNERRYGT